MRIITGATGFIGRRVVERLRAEGHAVRGISTRTPPRPEDLEGCDAVIHLSGEPVAQRWTPDARERIRASRVEGTRALVAAFRPGSPSVLVSASAVGYYGSRGEEILNENASPATDFLATVAVEWEREAQNAEKLGVRVVRLRIAMVLGPDGGALERMLLPFRLGIGGRIGSGKQWMSWIHREDLVSLIRFALDNPSVRGAVNACAPNPVTNAEFTRALARALHRPAIFPIPRFALKLLFGEMAEIIFASQRAIPEAAVRAGFEFRFPEAGAALNDVLMSLRARSSG
ncbi:MAG: TIGR01777 family protein [Acidobacteria bacterium]|nr:MAG: TIGR01777 family protein [Acidobacteriota bacterium]